MLLTGPTGVVPALEEFERAAHGLDPVFANSPLLPEALLSPELSTARRPIASHGSESLRTALARVGAVGSDG